MLQKIGIGYDIHPLVAGRKLFLGGVLIPHSKGLEGHSDADVLLHAVCDALLGACGQGDIGEHFPNTDEQYRNISSLILLEKVGQLVRKQGYTIFNIDTMVLAEEPKIDPFKMQMRLKISSTLKIAESAVNIKATTQEGLQTSEGIAAYSVVLLTKEST